MRVRTCVYACARIRVPVHFPYLTLRRVRKAPQERHNQHRSSESATKPAAPESGTESEGPPLWNPLPNAEVSRRGSPGPTPPGAIGEMNGRRNPVITATSVLLPRWHSPCLRRAGPRRGIALTNRGDYNCRDGILRGRKTNMNQ